MKSPNIWWVYLSTAIALAGVAIHLGAIVGGASWYAFFGAPPRIVASAREGTWLAPLSALFIAALMGVCVVYAGSVLGFVRRPPLQRAVLAAIAVVCMLRGLALPVLALKHLELLNTFQVISATVWFVAGVGFAVGFSLVRTGA